MEDYRGYGVAPGKKKQDCISYRRYSLCFTLSIFFVFICFLVLYKCQGCFDILCSSHAGLSAISPLVAGSSSLTGHQGNLRSGYVIKLSFPVQWLGKWFASAIHNFKMCTSVEDTRTQCKRKSWPFVCVQFWILAPFYLELSGTL